MFEFDTKDLEMCAFSKDAMFLRYNKSTLMKFDYFGNNLWSWDY